MKESKFKIFAISSFFLAVVALILCIIMVFSMFAVTGNQPEASTNNGQTNNETDEPKTELPKEEVPSGPDTELPEQNVPTVPKLEFPDDNPPSTSPDDSSNSGNCGSNNGETTQKPEIKFADVGEKYQIVVKPLYDAAKTILNDLVESRKIVLDYEHNPRIVGLRYEASFWITIRQDVYVYKNGAKSEFLQQEYSISIKNFNNTNEAYNAYRQFIVQEKNETVSVDYVEAVLPLAQNAAELILKGYKNYRNDLDIEKLYHGKQIILQADSSLSEVHRKIVENLNVALAERNYPLITNQSINVSFGGNIYWDIVYRYIIIKVNVNNFGYTFNLSFNENGEFTEEFLNYFCGTGLTGYTPADPDQMNPKNEEYSEFFNALRIEEMDLTNLKNYGEGRALYSAEKEYSFLEF